MGKGWQQQAAKGSEKVAAAVVEQGDKVNGGDGKVVGGKGGMAEAELELEWPTGRGNNGDRSS